MLAWLRLGCLEPAWLRAEPKARRYRLLHVAARVIRRTRRVVLRLPAHWPWALALAAAYRRLACSSPENGYPHSDGLGLVSDALRLGNRAP